MSFWKKKKKNHIYNIIYINIYINISKNPPGSSRFF